MSDEIDIRMLWAACANDDERRAVLREHELRLSRDRALTALQMMRPRKDYAPELKEFEVLSRLNGHAVKWTELRGAMPKRTFYDTVNRLIKRGQVRHVRQGYYERAKP